MKRKLLVVTAHPDDESFGPGGTIAKYAKEGVEVHLICATRGEAGEEDVELRVKNSGLKDKKLHDIREQELMSASMILGTGSVEFLNFIDGTLNNEQYHKVADKIIAKFESFRPQVVMTFEPQGVSGHLDHIAMSFITTYAYFKSDIPQKLYYHCLPREFVERSRRFLKDYFVYFPTGYPHEDITTRIDVASVWDKRIKAVKEHKSQWQDVQTILNELEARGLKTDHYILRDSRVQTKNRETDLFEGLD